MKGHTSADTMLVALQYSHERVKYWTLSLVTTLLASVSLAAKSEEVLYAHAANHDKVLMIRTWSIGKASANSQACLVLLLLLLLVPARLIREARANDIACLLLLLLLVLLCRCCRRACSYYGRRCHYSHTHPSLCIQHSMSGKVCDSNRQMLCQCASAG